MHDVPDARAAVKPSELFIRIPSLPQVRRRFKAASTLRHALKPLGGAVVNSVLERLHEQRLAQVHHVYHRLPVIIAHYIIERKLRTLVVCFTAKALRLCLRLRAESKQRAPVARAPAVARSILAQSSALFVSPNAVVSLRGSAAVVTRPKSERGRLRTVTHSAAKLVVGQNAAAHLHQILVHFEKSRRMPLPHAQHIVHTRHVGLGRTVRLPVQRAINLKVRTLRRTLLHKVQHLPVHVVVHSPPICARRVARVRV